MPHLHTFLSHVVCDNASNLKHSPTPYDSITTPLWKSQKLSSFYNTELNGVSDRGKTVYIPLSAFTLDQLGSEGIIIDSSTTITHLHSEAYNLVRDVFVKLT